MCQRHRDADGVKASRHFDTVAFAQELHIGKTRIAAAAADRQNLRDNRKRRDLLRRAWTCANREKSSVGSVQAQNAKRGCCQYGDFVHRICSVLVARRDQDFVVVDVAVGRARGGYRRVCVADASDGNRDGKGLRELLG